MTYYNTLFVFNTLGTTKTLTNESGALVYSTLISPDVELHSSNTFHYPLCDSTVSLQGKEVILAGRGHGYDSTLPLKNTVLQYINGYQTFFIRLQTPMDGASEENSSSLASENNTNIAAIVVIVVMLLVLIAGIIVGAAVIMKTRKQGIYLPIITGTGAFPISNEDGKKTIAMLLTSKTIGEKFFKEFQNASKSIDVKERIIFRNAIRLRNNINMSTVWLNNWHHQLHIVVQGT